MPSLHEYFLEKNAELVNLFILHGEEKEKTVFGFLGGTGDLVLVYDPRTRTLEFVIRK